MSTDEVMRRRPHGSPRRTVACLASLTLGALFAATFAAEGWIDVGYADLIDERRLSHSGQSVGVLLRALEGRPMPPPGERPADRTLHSLLEPLLEPYAFVLSDATDTLDGAALRARVEIGALWHPGEAQPAWVELLRARSYVLESDGRGALRAFVPDPAGRNGIAADPVQAARRAWEAAWPVLRHPIAAEAARLATAGGARKIEIVAYPFAHAPERASFALGRTPYRTEFDDAAALGSGQPLDLDELQTFLDSGLTLEGGRLEANGTLQLFGSPREERPSLLGAPISLADVAVAYRAVFHGGLAEPYMSLDRGPSPQTTIVNYGGRLRDTALGMVSLLCDIRFKTFSLGLDVVEGEDLRPRVRAVLPEFRTHLERFAADPGSAQVVGQQTRLWFYPDEVDLTLSTEADVLALRRVRMSAASERVESDLAAPSAASDPPWTVRTVEAINSDYDRLARVFPEMHDLDQVVRLLSLFTWLREARDAGRTLPDLDVLLAVELPALPTPRSYPQLLTFDALPVAGGDGAVAVLERADVVSALDRLNPVSARALDPGLRYRRAVSMLDRADPQHAAFLVELEGVDPSALDPSTVDFLAHRAERLRMHDLVLTTLDSTRGAALAARSDASSLRVFSVGIGGLDLGMGAAVARARGRSLSLGGGRAVSGIEPTTAATVVRAAPRAAVAQVDAATVASVVEPLPAHGATAEGRRARISVGEREMTVLHSADGDDARLRRLVLDAQGSLERIERYESALGNRLASFVLVPVEGALRARRSPLPSADLPAEDATPTPPSGLVRMQLREAEAGDGLGAVRVTLETLDAGVPRRLEADFPRAVLMRLVLGRELDTEPEKAMPLSPLPPSLGRVEALMAMLGPGQTGAPWQPSTAAYPGEVHPVRVARAANAWRKTDPAATGAPAVVGVDPAVSPARWLDAPRLGGALTLLLPRDGFPGVGARLRGEVEAAWSAGPIVERLGSAPEGPIVVLVAAEAAGPFADRLRRLAGDPSMAGKLLAAWNLGEAPRADLPADLMRSGGLAGFALADSDVLSRRSAAPRLNAWAQAAVSPLGAGQRVESLDGPWLWWF